MQVRQEGLMQAIISENQEMLEKYDPDTAIDLFDQVEADRAYNHVPDNIEHLWSSLAGEFGKEGLDAFQKTTMLRLMERFEARSVGKRYCENIRKRFCISFDRILKSMENKNFKRYSTINDILIKDLAICRQHVFPGGGGRIVEPRARLSMSLAFRGGLVQALKFAGRIHKIRGGYPFYSHHTHLSELKEFNPKGYREMNINLAEMLKLNPDIIGIHCGSWLYDPALETISPELSYLRRLPQDNGALVLFYTIDVNAGALAKSKHRKNLYEQKKYLPKSYHIIWLRKDVLKWANNNSL